MQFVIFHGSFGSSDGNWFPYLKNELKKIDQKVLVPQFPVEDYDAISQIGPQVEFNNQNLTNWLKFFENKILPKLDKNEPLCFIGHSIGPVFILHLIKEFKIKLDSAIFVSPFYEKIKFAWQYNKANETFYNPNFNFINLRKYIPVSYIIYSKSDPYVPEENILHFANKMKSSIIEVKDGGHLNAEFDLVKFPLILELCKTRIPLKTYNYS